MRWDPRWRGRLLALAVTAAALLLIYDAVMRWDVASLGAPSAAREPAPLAPGELRVVTWNAWRLRAPERVPSLVEAIDRVGAQLARAQIDRPELISIQEIESREAVDALARELGEGGTFVSCECARAFDGSLRSAVAIAVREPLTVEGHECIPLESIIPDHSRCAVLARVVDEEGRRFDFVGAHLAWHFANRPMAERLRRELDQRGALGPRTILAGDLNSWPGTATFEHMTDPPLRDARPGAPPTFFWGWRLDAVLVGEAFEIVRGIDRRWTYDAFSPAARWTLPRACASEGAPACPLSDHLPEAVVLRWR